MDSAGYMKRNYDTESMPTQQGQEINAARLHPPAQRSIEAYTNLLVAPFEHFSSWLLISKPRTKTSNVLECLDYMQQCLTPDLATSG